MKRLTVLVTALLLAVIVGIAMPVMWQENRNAYERDLVQHFAAAIGGDGVQAVYGDTTTLLATPNTERLLPVLCRSEREFVRHERDHTGEWVGIYVDDEMSLIVEAPDPAVDLVYIYYTCGAQKSTLCIEDYRTMYWITQLIAPDGLYGVNTVLDPESL